MRRSIVKVTGVLLLVLSLSFVIPAPTVTADDGDGGSDLATVVVGKGYTHVMSGDSFTCRNVTGTQSWSSGLVMGSQNLTGVTAALESAIVFDDFTATAPSVGQPPLYQWDQDILFENETWDIGVESANTTEFNPGFDAVRSVNQTYFTASGRQYLTVYITPKVMTDEIAVEVTLPQKQGYSALFFLTAGNQSDVAILTATTLKIVTPDPVPGRTYSFEMIIDVALDPGMKYVEFLPEVGFSSTTVSGNGVFDDPADVSYIQNRVGTWLWKADQPVANKWQSRVTKTIRMEGISDALSIVEFQTRITHVTLEGFDLRNSALDTDYQGIVIQRSILHSDTDIVSLIINGGWQLLDSDGEPLTRMTFTMLNGWSLEAEGYSIVKAFDLGPNGATFEPFIELDVFFPLSGSPKDKTQVLAYLDGEEWILLDTSIGTHEDGNAIARITHFTTFALLAPLSPPTGEGQSTGGETFSQIDVSTDDADEKGPAERTLWSAPAWWLWLIAGIEIIAILIVSWLLRRQGNTMS